MSKGIYAYVDKKDNNVVYVGKDSNIHGNKRHKDHFCPSGYNKQVINRILQNNPDRYEYKVLWEIEDCTNNHLNEMEKYYTRIYNPKFSFTEGGDGIAGLKRTEETKKKISKTRSKKYNTTGFYRVYKAKDNAFKQGFRWSYQYSNESKKQTIMSLNLLELKDKVEAKGLPWKILNEEKAKQSLEENEKTLKKIKNTPNGNKGKTRSLEQRKTISKTMSTTGFFRVDKDKDNTCKQGFLWRYRYQQNKKIKKIRRVNLLKLQEEVEVRGLPWEILDEEKAKKSLEENNKYHQNVKK